MADHLRTGPVVDALETTLWHRRVEPGAVHRRRFDGPELPTLKCEPLDRRATFRNRTDAKLAVFDSIEGSSNHPPALDPPALDPPALDPPLQRPTVLWGFVGGPEVALRMVCLCGYVIEGADDEEFWSNAQSHMGVLHPELVGKVTRDDLLAQAELV